MVNLTLISILPYFFIVVFEQTNADWVANRKHPDANWYFSYLLFFKWNISKPYVVTNKSVILFILNNQWKLNMIKGDALCFNSSFQITQWFKQWSKLNWQQNRWTCIKWFVECYVESLSSDIIRTSCFSKALN